MEEKAKRVVLGFLTKESIFSLTNQLPYKAEGPGVAEFRAVKPLIEKSRLQIEDYRQAAHSVSKDNVKTLLIQSSDSWGHTCITESGLEVILTPTKILTNGKGSRVPLSASKRYSFAVVAQEEDIGLILVPYEMIRR